MSWSSNLKSQSEYINELARHLERLPESERADILRDQDEFFREALLSGRTEADVIGSLGEPKQLAKTLIAESRVAASESTFQKPSSTGTQVNAALRAFFAIVTLAPFNLIFVLGPFLGLLGCLFAGWVIGAAMLLGGFGSFFIIASELTGLGASGWAHLSATLLGLSISMMSLAFLVLMTWITSFVAQISVRYLRWNLDLIAERKS